MQWEKAAGERGLTGADPIKVTWGKPSRSIAGPLAAAVSSRQFDPLPGLVRAEEAMLAAGQISDLHAVYGGLGSGRLVMTGPPGAGKSGAAVLLILAALRHRRRVPVQDKRKVPVLILVTIRDWDPGRQPVSDWLTRQLQNTYALFTGADGAATAAALIGTGRIAVILDGLDEIAADLRPVALQALSEQASFRVVVLSRTAEIASAASGRSLLRGAAAIELRAVDPAEAASYLERVQLDPPPDGWRDLLGRIRNDPASPLGKALDNPLTLTLVRDTCRSGDDVRELLEFCDVTLCRGLTAGQSAEAVTGYLLDRVLPAAYAHRPGQQALPYDLVAARNALTEIAACMNRDGTRDLYWWYIPSWTRPFWRICMAGLVIGLAVGLAVGLANGLIDQPFLTGIGKTRVGIESGLVAALVAGGAGILLAARPSLSGNQPRAIVKFRIRRILHWKNLITCLVGCFVGGLAVLLVSLLPMGSLEGALFVSGAGNFRIVLLAGFWGGLVFGIANTLTADPDSSASLSPATSWRSNRNFGVVAALAAGVPAGLAAGAAAGLAAGAAAGLATGWRTGLALV